MVIIVRKEKIMSRFNIEVAENGYIYREYEAPGVESSAVIFIDPLQLIQHIRQVHPIDSDGFVYDGHLSDENKSTSDD